MSLCLGAVGCVTVSPATSKESAAAESLASHVQFLSQPALKGRQTGSHGARLARRYIEERFRSCGLVPWQHKKSFELSFGYGCNVVGVMPGADTNLADEIIILSAHYDHLGKDSHGRICPGASDNASGVAVLLEAARQLSRSETRPRRSIAFASFDSEENMLFGSFAFAGRPDVVKAKIVAVLNLDMLGRDFFDVVSNTVFVVGTEAYPGLRQSIRQAGTRAGLRVLPVGSDLIGPRSDHVAFESRLVPSLFLTSGVHRDYHQYTDTAEKLDYAELTRSAQVVVDSIRGLADGPPVPPPTPGNGADVEELRTLCTVLSEVEAQRERARIKPQDAEAFAKLERQAEGLQSGGQYDSKQRAELLCGASGTLAPYLLSIDMGQAGLGKDQQQDMLLGLQFLQGFYLSHRLEMLEAYHRLVAHILKYRPGVFRGMPEFRHEICVLGDNDLLFADRGNGQYELHALIMPMILEAQTRSWHGLIKLPSFGLFGFWSGIEETGTREQLTDLCLLRLRACERNSAETGAYLRVLHTVSGAATNVTTQALLRERLRRGACQDETDWIAGLMMSDRPELALEAIKAATPDKQGRIRNAACALIADRAVRPDVRARAMELAMKARNKTVLLALCAVFDDPGPAVRKEYVPLLRADSPFADRPMVKTVQPLTERALLNSSEAGKSIGDLARNYLKKAAGHDLGQDPASWRQWVEARAH